METVSGFKRFIVCRVTQSKSLNQFILDLFFPVSLNKNIYKINKNNSEIILG